MNVAWQTGTEAEILNRECYCVSLDQDALRRELAAQLGAREASEPLLQSHPHLFASLPVFVSRRHVSRMAEIIAAVESVVSDHALGAALAVRHLASLGHRKVGLVVSRQSPTSPHVRRGWLEAAAECGFRGDVGADPALSTSRWRS